MTASTASPSPASLPTTQDVPMALWGELATLDELVADGTQRQALARARRLLDHADGPDRAELADMITSLEQARDADWQPPQPADLRRYVPPGAVEVRHTAPRPGTGRPDDGAATAAAYLAEQGPAPIEPGGWDESVWGKSVDDLGALVAMVPLNGGPCLHCRLERTPADLANLDGLCTDCRVGGVTRESALRARCADIAARAGARARGLLQAAWRRTSRPADRAVIAAWVAEHTAPVPGAAAN
jgi:hypothetical protein